MSQRVAIITAIYDSYDTLKLPLPQEGVDVEFVCVTDEPREPNGWQLIIEPRPAQHPNVAAKRPKMLPWEYTTADFSIWLDASFKITSPTFALGAIGYAMKDHGYSPSGIAQFTHPWRDCIYDEAAASVVLPKYAGLPIVRQMALYREWGHPEHWGLWATGLTVRDHDVAAVRTLGERWLRTCQEWSFQDQLSEAVHLRSLGLRPVQLPGTHLHNEWVQYQGSSRH